MASFNGRGSVYIHGGQEPDPHTGAVVPPIPMATTFQAAELGVHAGVDDPNSFGRGYDYSRTGNPTRGAFERALAAAESAEHCQVEKYAEAAGPLHEFVHGVYDCATCLRLGEVEVDRKQTQPDRAERYESEFDTAGRHAFAEQ